MSAAPRALTVLAAALSACTLAAALPAVSSAADFCVQSPACVSAGGTAEPDVPTAVSVAAAIFGTDRVLIGPGTFHLPSGLSYNTSAALNSVEIAGSGQGATVLLDDSNSPNETTLTLSGKPLSSVRDLSLVAKIGQFKSTPTALDFTGTAQRVDVQAGADAIPVKLEDGATLRDSHVSAMAPAIAAVQTAGKGNATIAGSTIDGGGFGGIRMSTEGTLAVTATRVSARNAVVAANPLGTVTIDSSLVRTIGTGLQAFDGHLHAVNVTVVGDGKPFSTGAEGFNGGALVLENSVLANVDRALNTAHFSGTPSLTASYSNYTGKVVQSAGTLTEAQGNTHLDPGFVDAAAGDFRLRADSPLLDLGQTGQLPSSDLGGDPRMVDGTGKGTAAPDVGAFEFQPHAPTAVIAAAGGAAIGEAVTFSSAPSSDPDPGDSLTSHWSIAGVPADGPEQSRSFPSAGPVSVTLTVTDLSGHSATASKTIDITAPPVANPPVQAGGPDGPPLVSRFAISRKRFAAGRRAAFSFKLSEDARVRIVVTRSHQLLRRSRRAGALVRAGHSGPNEVRFSGRIGKRSLKPGRYVATLRATDLAGRVSAGRTVAFTILR